jgi:hypothetical protein
MTRSLLSTIILSFSFVLIDAEPPDVGLTPEEPVHQVLLANIFEDKDKKVATSFDERINAYFDRHFAAQAKKDYFESFSELKKKLTETKLSPLKAKVIEVAKEIVEGKLGILGKIDVAKPSFRLHRFLGVLELIMKTGNSGLVDQALDALSSVTGFFFKAKGFEAQFKKFKDQDADKVVFFLKLIGRCGWTEKEHPITIAGLVGLLFEKYLKGKAVNLGAADSAFEASASDESSESDSKKLGLNHLTLAALGPLL